MSTAPRIPQDVSQDSKGSGDGSDGKSTQGKDKLDSQRTPTLTNGGSQRSGEQPNPFDEEEWDEEAGDALVDNGEPGVPVKALYDYEGAESDELSFKQGKFILKIFIYQFL